MSFSKNIQLCNMDLLYQDVSATIPAKIIAENGQDYNFLFNDLTRKALVTLNFSNQCINDVGKLNFTMPMFEGTINNPDGGSITINPIADTSIEEIAVSHPKASLSIENVGSHEGNFKLGKLSAPIKSQVNINMAGSNGHTKITQLYVSGATLSNMSGQIVELDKLRDTGGVTLSNCELSSSELRSSGLKLTNSSVIQNCNIKCHVTGTNLSLNPAGKVVPTLSVTNSVIKNSIIDTYDFSYVGGGQVKGIPREPFDLAVKFKQDCSLQDFKAVEGSFHGDPDFLVVRGRISEIHGGQLIHSVGANRVAILRARGIKSNFSSIDSIDIEGSRFDSSGTLLPAMPNKTPPIPERIVPAYMNGGPFIATDLITTTELYSSVSIFTDSLPNYGVEGEHNWFGFWNVLGSVRSHGVALGGVTNRGTITADRIYLRGGTAVSGATVFNFGTMKMSRFSNGASEESDGNQILFFPGASIQWGDYKYTTPTAKLWPSEFNVNDPIYLN